MVCPWRRSPMITWKFPLGGRYCLKATESSNRLCRILELGPMCLALVFSWMSSGRRTQTLRMGRRWQQEVKGVEGESWVGKRGHMGAAESEESQTKPKTRQHCCFYFGARIYRLKLGKENRESGRVRELDWVRAQPQCLWWVPAMNRHVRSLPDLALYLPCETLIVNMFSV